MPQKIQTALSTAKTGVKGILTFTILSILLTITVLNAGVQAIQQKSLRPLIYEIGGRIMSADEVIYQKGKYLEANPYKVNRQIFEQKILQEKGKISFFDNVGFFFSSIWIYIDILVNFAFIIVMGILIYKFVAFALTQDTMFTIKNVLITIVFMALLQSLFGVILLSQIPRQESASVSEVALAMTPFKGIFYSLFFVFPKVISGAYNNIVVPVESIQQQTGVIGTITKVIT